MSIQLNRCPRHFSMDSTAFSARRTRSAQSAGSMRASCRAATQLRRYRPTLVGEVLRAGGTGGSICTLSGGSAGPSGVTLSEKKRQVSRASARSMSR